MTKHKHRCLFPEHQCETDEVEDALTAVLLSVHTQEVDATRSQYHCAKQEEFNARLVTPASYALTTTNDPAMAKTPRPEPGGIAALPMAQPVATVDDPNTL